MCNHFSCGNFDHWIGRSLWISETKSVDRLCGIYVIENVNSGKIYIGGSVDIFSRWRLHVHELRHKKHRNGRLQCSFNKHGESAWKFTVIELCPPESLTETEQGYLDREKPYKNGYNIAADANRPMVGTKHRPESIAKMSASQKRINAEQPDRFKGRIVSQETRDKLSKIFTGFKHTEEAKKKIGEASRARGKFTEEH